MKIFVFLFSVCVIYSNANPKTLTKTQENEIVCEIGNYSNSKNMKWCVAKFNPIILSKDQTIQKVTLSENGNWSIIEIIIRNQTMFYFPKFNTNLFDEIIKLVVLNSKLKEIHREDLKQFPKLNYLEIINNDLTEIDNDLFDDNPLIIDVKLNENKIKSIPFQVVMNLEKYEGPMSFINKNKYSEILSKYKKEVREKNKYLVDRDTLINQLQANNTKSTEIIEELEKEKEKLKIEQNELQVNKIQSSEHIQKLQLEIEVLNGKLSNCQQIIQTTEDLLTTTTLDTKIVKISTEKQCTEISSNEIDQRSIIITIIIIGSLMALNFISFIIICFLCHRLRTQSFNKTLDSSEQTHQLPVEMIYSDPAYDTLPENPINQESQYEAIWENSKNSFQMQNMNRSISDERIKENNQMPVYAEIKKSNKRQRY